MNTNLCILTGKSLKNFKKHCVTKGETFYIFTLDVKRNSGTDDILKIVTSEKLLNKEIVNSDFLTVKGDIRTFDKENGGVDIYLFCRDIEVQPEEKYFNRVELQGFLCKKGTQRSTNSGRKVVDFILAINRMFKKSDYLPIIAWNKNVNYILNRKISTEINVVGRFQSRPYFKKNSDGTIEEKIAYEISAARINANVDIEKELINNEPEQEQ